LLLLSLLFWVVVFENKMEWNGVGHFSPLCPVEGHVYTSGTNCRFAEANNRAFTSNLNTTTILGEWSEGHCLARDKMTGWDE
jgi:hypothetical protein